MQDLTQLTNKGICSNTKEMKILPKERICFGWVGGTQHFGQWAISSVREIAHCPKCNKAAAGSRKGR